MTISQDRILELTCFTDDALAAMVGGDGYYSESADEYFHATLEEVQAVFAYRARKDAEWIMSLDPAERQAMVDAGELSASDVIEASGLLRAGEPVLTLAKRPATKPKLVAHDDCRQEVAIGDIVLSFRGEPAKLMHLVRANGDGRDGKVVVSWQGEREAHGQCEYYAGVFNLTVSEAGRMQVGS